MGLGARRLTAVTSTGGSSRAATRRAGAPHRRLASPPTFGSLVVAGLLWVLSLWPTLLPRDLLRQAAISAVCAAIGWLVGAPLSRTLHEVLVRNDRPLAQRTRHRAWLVLAATGTVVAVVALLLWSSWQNDQRDALGMAAIAPWLAVPLLVLTLVLTSVLVLLGRLAANAARWVDRQVARVIRPRWVRLASAVVILVAVVVGVDLVEREAVEWADASFGAVNDTTPDDVEQPQRANVSGSPDSLVAWDTLGREGRVFAAGATPTEALAQAAAPGVDVAEPVRVYVGLDSADSAAARTDLALRELERTGAFDREVLVVATSTGTGWINPVAATTLELMYGGDTAIVTQQYSFLPSWIAFVVDRSTASDAGATLFDAVHRRWSTLPEDDRPRLVVYGESLGSFGAEAAFAGDDLDASLAAMAERTDGALFTGPTAGNPVFGDLVAHRDPGSPAWRPELGRDPHVRATVDLADIEATAEDPGWVEPRLLYVHHPTDAVGTWQPDAVWRPPGWTDHPTGVGVPGRVRWFPVVTWVQETGDLMAGFSAKTGFGHDYDDAFVAAWSAVAPPSGWTDADAGRLTDLLPSLVPAA